MSTPDRRLRALIYNRVSSDPSGRRVSVESQDGENRAWCDRESIEVAASITDNDRSASRVATKEREGYRQVRTALAGQTFGRIDYLVVWESSRAERTLDGHVELRRLCVDHDVRLVYKGRVFDMSSGDDRFTTGIDALVDEREAERIRERILRGHRTSAAAGRPRGTVPYGYQRKYDRNTGYLADQIPDPVTAPIVRGIVADVLAGATLYDIVQRLNTAGIATPLGRKEQQAGIETNRVWTSTSIRRLLESRSMIGVRTHNGQIYEKPTWEPLVSAEDWARCQRILADPGRVAHHRGLDPKYLLSGVATCGVCGAWVRAASNRGRMVYQCAGYGPGDSRGKGHVARSLAHLDAWVMVRVGTYLASDELRERLAPRPQPSERDGAALRKLGGLRAQLAEFESEALAGRISAGSFGRIEAGLLTQIAALEQETAAVVLPPVVAAVAGVGAEQRFPGLPLMERRRVVRAVCRVVVQRAARRGVRGFDPSTVEIIWAGSG